MTFWTEVGQTALRYLPRFSYLRRSNPIDSLDSVFDYTSTRAAFVCQKKLYGYVKTRVGTRFPKLMDDEIFVRSLNIAKLEVFAACLADMTCFCVADSLAESGVGNDVMTKLAVECYERGIAANDDGSCGAGASDKWRAAFDDRLKKTVWHTNGPAHFIDSPRALVRWAPIAEDLKKLDAEIVENSILNAWIEFRKEFVDRVDRGAVASSVGG